MHVPPEPTRSHHARADPASGDRPLPSPSSDPAHGGSPARAPYSASLLPFRALPDARRRLRPVGAVDIRHDEQRRSRPAAGSAPETEAEAAPPSSST
jgi:hypothetical protein